MDRNGRIRKHATIHDFRDMDLMMKLAAEGGSAATWELAEAMGFHEDDRQGLAIRLSWMRRYGMLTFDEDRRIWMLSEGGERVTESRIRAAMKTQIERIPDEAMVEIMASVTSRYRLGEPMIANLLRREFVFGTSPR